MSSHPDHAVDLVAGAGVGRAEREPPADVEIDVSASASELRPLEHSRTGSTVSGSEGVRRNDAVWRRNVPSRLEPGAVYRDVRIRRRVTGHLAFPGRRDG
jgi:hypothetical protein